MSTPWIIAVVSLWVLLAIVALGVIALARQVGLLHLRVKPVGAGGGNTGPPIGSAVVIPEIESLRSKRLHLIGADGVGVVLFVSSGCGLCKPVLEGAARLRSVEEGLALTVAVDGGQGELEYLTRHGFEDGVAADALANLDSGNRPYAVAVSGMGVVLEGGAVNTLEQLENMVDLAKRRLASEEDGAFESIDSNGSWANGGAAMAIPPSGG